MVTQSFVIKESNQKIKTDSIAYGSFNSIFVENNGRILNFIADSLPTPPDTIENFKLIQSDYPTHFINDSMFITYVYEPSTTESSNTKPKEHTSKQSSNNNKYLPKTGESSSRLIVFLGIILTVGSLTKLYFKI